MDHSDRIGTELPDTSSRRAFLKRARSWGIAAAVLPWLAHLRAVSALAVVEIQDLSLETTSPPSATAPPPLSGSGASTDYNLFQSPQQYALSLGTGPPVQVFGFYGGEPVAQFITDPAAADSSFPRKLARIQYRDIVFYYLPVQGAAINAWLIDSLTGKVPLVSGGIHIRGGQWGMSGNAIPNSYSSHMSFAGAFIKQIAFPETDRTSEMPAPLRITLAIQQAEWHPGASWNIAPLQADLLKGPLKNQFTLGIQNLSLNDVTRIDPIVLSMTLMPASQGGGYQGAAPRELSTLRIQLPESTARDLYTWHNDFVVKRLPGGEQERMGLIQWMNPQNPSKTVLKLKLFGLGILSVIRLPSKPGYVQVEMYCEKLVPELL